MLGQSHSITIQQKWLLELEVLESVDPGIYSGR